MTAIALARHGGARVLCTVGNDAKVAAAKAAGADVAINYRTQDFVTEVSRLTEGRGVDVILDMVGGSYIERNLRCLALEGRLVQIAFLQPSKVELDWMPLMLKRLTFTGSTLRPRPAAEKARIAAELRRQVWPLLEQGGSSRDLSASSRWPKRPRRTALMESSEHIGKIVLKVA